MKKTKADLEIELNELKKNHEALKIQINQAICNILDEACDQARPYVNKFYNEVTLLKRPTKSYIVTVPVDFFVQLNVWDGDDTILEDNVDIKESDFVEQVDGNV